MTVGELIEHLKEFDESLPVHIAYNYGDYWKTRVTPKAKRVEESSVVYSEYHRMPKEAIKYDEDGKLTSEADESTSAVLISE